MKKLAKILSIILLISVLAGCGTSVSTPVQNEAPDVEETQVQETSAPAEEYPLYVNLTWHQHQPLYYKDENGVIQGFGDPRTYSSEYLFKGDYIKLKSVTLGYTLPATTKIQNLLQQLRVFASFENLYTLTKYPGWDPEGQGRIEYWDIPQLFSASIGVSVKF